MNTKLLSTTDRSFFSKSAQTYLFFRQSEQEQFPISIVEKMQEGRNLTFSLITVFLKTEKFEISYLQEINELLKELNHEFELVSLNLSPEFILPNSLQDITLSELVPIRFTDEDTNEKWQILFHSKEGICMWNVTRD